ncbi:hypothetical protein ACVIGB_000020 [Bradyrhizobium sp. USDA 4341]
MNRKVTLALALAAALGATALPAEARPFGYFHGGGGVWAGGYHGYRPYGWSASTVGFGYEGGPIYGNYVYPLGYGSYYSPAQSFYSSDVYDRYYDTDLYVPSCFRRQVLSWPDGFAETIINTCY